jgi:hypothetical protein
MVLGLQKFPWIAADTLKRNVIQRFDSHQEIGLRLQPPQGPEERRTYLIEVA